LRVLLPNKEVTAISIPEEIIFLDALKLICEKRQYDHRDYVLAFENSKKKIEEIDMTLQCRQCEDIKEVILQRG